MQDTEVDLFPGGTANNEPQTPPRNDHLNAAAPGELSPPRSQGNSTADTANAGNPAPAAMNGNGSAFTANGTTSQLDSAGSHAPFAPDAGTSFDGDGKWQPGEWKSKKSQDEMARAWEYVVDKEWSAREYGDVVMRGKQARGVA